MATVTGTYQINFAPLANTNPYTNSDFLTLDNPDSTEGDARIDGGLIRSQDSATHFYYRLNPTTYPASGTTFRVKMEVGKTNSINDGIGVSLLDTSGNGYVLQVGNSNWIRYRYDAWVPHFDSGWAEAISTVDGDTAELEYNKSTGLIRIYRNGTAITVMETTDTVYAASAIAPVLSQGPGDTGDGGIRSFAVDGVSTGSTNTNLPVDSGTTLTISGQDVALSLSGFIVMPVTNATLTFAGQNVQYELGSPWADVSLNLTGQNVNLIAGQSLSMSVENATMTLTGSDVTLAGDFDFTLSVDNATATLTGQNITFLLQGNVVATVENGTVVVSGQDVGLNLSVSLPASGGGRRTRKRALRRLLNFGR